MNNKILQSIVFRLPLTVCLLSLIFGKPAPSPVRATTQAGRPPEPSGAPGAMARLPAAPEAVTYTAIAAGGTHTCALTSSGGARCWGSNEYGQLGDGNDSTQSDIPVDVVGLAQGVTAIATGGTHTCAVVAGGVKCWGYGQLGELGDGASNNSSTPVDVVGLTSGVTAIAAGGSHTCALTSSGGVKCWGRNQCGQLGNGATTIHNTPVDVVGLAEGVTSIAAGGSHTCALVSGGGAKCWGANWFSQLGDGTWTDRSTPVDVVRMASGVTAIAAGYGHTCAVMAGGGARCWGGNWVGQLGDGTFTNRSTPVDVAELASGVTAIAAGYEHTCALVSGGGAKCWGENKSGQLGIGATDNRNTPVDVSGLAEGVTVISAGGHQTCAVGAGGRALCWGSNGSDMLGIGKPKKYNIPQYVVGLAGGVTAITAGDSHTCTLVSGGGVQCWGSNWGGQLGEGTLISHSAPVDVIGLASGVTAVNAGGSHTCAVVSGGGVKCWGWNLYGQLGDGTNNESHTPVDVVGLSSGVDAITAGDLHTCALVAGGVKCWGWNVAGQLGNGTTTDSNTPVDVVGLANGVAAIAAGGSHTCALLAGGGVQCWGYNLYGQLGDGTSNNSSTPVDVAGLAGEATAITAGNGHTCALVSAGIMCWGLNGAGQLGNGTTTDSKTPVQVVGLEGGVTAIAARVHNTCALTSEGEGKCWGWNPGGQLGDGTWTDHSTPADVVGLASGASAIATGGVHTCALVGAGRPKCWGDNSSWQLGLGYTTPSGSLTPVDVYSAVTSLSINYPNGQPGSFFTLTGWNYPPGAQAALTINGQVFTTTITVNPTGSFIAFLDASLAEEGGYAVTVSATPTSTLSSPETSLAEPDDFTAPASFFLSGDAPTRPQEGGGQTFLVPTGIALHDFVYLPLVKR